MTASSQRFPRHEANANWVPSKIHGRQSFDGLPLKYYVSITQDQKIGVSFDLGPNFNAWNLHFKTVRRLNEGVEYHLMIVMDFDLL